MKVKREGEGTGYGIVNSFFVDWCPRPESNRHDFFESADFKSAVSTDFTTRARETKILAQTLLKGQTPSDLKNCCS